MFGRQPRLDGQNKGRTEDATWVEDPKKRARDGARRTATNSSETAITIGSRLHQRQRTGAVVSMKGKRPHISRMWMGMRRTRRFGVTRRSGSVVRLHLHLKDHCQVDTRTVTGTAGRSRDGMGDGEKNLHR